jgi:aryl-alcohol dehydrogenase-like predicted oxidoreductase
MEYINLGKSDLKVSRLGFGCCPMGGHAWGKVSEGEFRDAVLAALDAKINFFDTADIYGFGRSEELLGKFLKLRRREAVIATKFGLRADGEGKIFYDNSPVWIEEALDASLSRLGVSHIDLYQVHYLDGKTPITDVIEILEKKRKEGKIRYYGLSNISLENIADFAPPEALVSFQAEYSLAERGKEKEIDLLIAEKSLSFISWGSLGQGVLTGKYGSDTTFGPEDRRSRAVYVNFHGEKLARNVDMVENTRIRFNGSGKTLPQIAVRWILDRFENSVALVGIKRPSQLLDNIGALGWQMMREDMAYLDSISR